VIKTITISDMASREIYRESFDKTVLSSEITIKSGYKGVYMVSVIYKDNSQGVSKLVIK
jgi:hypothetical protein